MVQRKGAYRFELFDHFNAITFHLTMNVTEFREDFTGPWLQLMDTDSRENISKIWQHNLFRELFERNLRSNFNFYTFKGL